MQNLKNDIHCCALTPAHRCLRSSCSSGQCTAGPGLQFGRLTPTPTKRKRTKTTNYSKKNLFIENNTKNIYSDESDEELPKYHSFDLEEKQIEEPISQTFNNTFEKRSDFSESLKSSEFLEKFEKLIHYFSKNCKINDKSDRIHNRYEQYYNQTQTQKDSSKTDYTYAHSFSYNKSIDPKNIWEWFVPNMSRRAVSVTKNIETTTTSSSTVSKSLLKEESKSSSVSSLQTSQNSLAIDNERRSRTPAAQMFTRSQCLGGAQCEAGCPLHHKSKRRSNKSNGILIPNSGQGLEPEIEFSEDDDYAYNYANQVNYERDTNYRNINGHQNDSQLSDDEEEEELHIRRRIYKFITTINSYTSRVTPNVVQNAAKKYWFLKFLTPFLFLLLISSIVLMGSRYYPTLTGLLSQNDNHLRSLTGDPNADFNQLIREIKELKDSNNELKLRMKSNDFEENERFNNLNHKIDSIDDYLNNIMKNCCRNETDEVLALIDLRLSSFMASMLIPNENNDQLMTPSEANRQLKDFIRLEMSKTIDNFKENIERKLMTTIDKFEQQMSHKSNHLSSNVNMDEIKTLITEALAIYDADKTGQPDFALEPAGGTIINTRCSETFDPYGVQYKIFGMPVWSSSVSPRAVIQPNISPGECWAFKGSNGYLVMKLSQPITPTAFSYEHIPKQISRDGNIDSAPKEFQVRGLEDESDSSGHLLGNYIYEDNGRPMQYFEVQNPNPRVFQFIELVILSNHGHNDYTCLYRFRVHGKRVGH